MGYLLRANIITKNITKAKIFMISYFVICSVCQRTHDEIIHYFLEYVQLDVVLNHTCMKIVYHIHDI